MKTWLFQGDSVTDCHRNRSLPGSMGDGYVSLLSQTKKGIKFVNKGVSGERTHDLVMRWTEDLMSTQPDYLTLLIGVNNIWHQYLLNRPSFLYEFSHHIKYMLNQVKRLFPDTKTLILSPFLFECGVVEQAWIHELDQQISELKSIANDYHLPFLDLHELFKKSKLSPIQIAEDGVHPTQLGHQIIAQAIKAKTPDWLG
jgi:lysophospholipase L1-like esterase